MIYQIGKLKLKNRLLLSPMLEPNDIAFRLLCKKAGCALTYTGMISPLSKQELFLDDKPAIQLFGNSDKGIREFIKKYDKKVSLWDFNLGCPSKLSNKLAHGAFMHEDLDAIERILKTMRESTKKPVTIKLRKSPKAIEIARLAEKYVDAIGIHPRTIKQGYSGKPDYDFALEIKKNVSVPIIYSGDVRKENVDKILGKKGGISFEEYVKLAEKYNLLFRQSKYQAMVFTKGMKNAKGVRRRLIGAKTPEELKEIMKTNK